MTTFGHWMQTSGRTPLALAYDSGVSLASVYRARQGKRVTFAVAEKLVAATGGVVALEALLRGAGAQP